MLQIYFKNKYDYNLNMYYIYSKKYGWNPLWFLLKCRNFYKERNEWVKIHLENRSLKYVKEYTKIY